MTIYGVAQVYNDSTGSNVLGVPVVLELINMDTGQTTTLNNFVTPVATSQILAVVNASSLTGSQYDLVLRFQEDTYLYGGSRRTIIVESGASTLNVNSPLALLLRFLSGYFV